jgi:SAM-dependent methyltransferase
VPRVDNTKFYNLSIKNYKKTAQGVHWASRGRQYARFELFKRILGDLLPESSVVDAGCGFGDLYHYLKAEDLLPRHYIGVDSHAQMVSISRKDTNQTIIHADILHDEIPYADYYLCSGAMNTLEPFETILFIRRMIEHAHKGVVFNLLEGESRSGTYNKFKPAKLQELLAFFNGSIEIYDDYLHGDFTLFMQKENA